MITHQYKKKYTLLNNKINEEFIRLNFYWKNNLHTATRKDLAEYIQKNCTHKSAMFALLDKKPEIVDKYIMKNIKPVGNVL